MTQNRIQLVDSFRFIAVILVLFYHLTRPYAVHSPAAEGFFHVFDYGYMGVYLFFVISGFIISLTLENTTNPGTFYLNRFKRLFPAMLLCSLITFLVASMLDNELLFKSAHQLRNFLPSLTFTNPAIWTKLSHHEFGWIDGSYWTLWIELQFYFVASAVYFLNKKKYAENLLLIGVVIALIKHVPIYIIANYSVYLQQHGLVTFFECWRVADEIFALTFNITWFICGAILYQLYKGLPLKGSVVQIFCIILILCFLIVDVHQFFPNIFIEMMIAALIIFGLFLLLIYRDKWLSFLKFAPLYRIGLISYSMYLIHAVIGVLLIGRYGSYLGSWNWLSPFIIVALVILFSEASYRFYEKPVSNLLKRTFSPRNAKQ